MTRRFWVCVGLTVPILALMFSEMLPGKPLQSLLGPAALVWVQFAFATPVVLWGGMAVFRSRLAIPCEPPSEHVHR